MMRLELQLELDHDVQPAEVFGGGVIGDSRAPGAQPAGDRERPQTDQGTIVIT
jgi:hypothetical protein